jgi:hypothetical protein
MAPVQSPWAQEYKRKREEAPEQFTVVRRYPPPQQQQQYYPNQQQPSYSGVIGNGVDGVLQPGKMAGQVHEGEGVLTANEMQGLTPEEFNALRGALGSGRLNKNMFLQSIGLSPVSGYQSGGIVDQRARGVPEPGAATPANTSFVPSVTRDVVSSPAISMSPIQDNTPYTETVKGQTRDTSPVVDPIRMRIDQPSTITETVKPIMSPSSVLQSIQPVETSGIKQPEPVTTTIQPMMTPDIPKVEPIKPGPVTNTTPPNQPDIAVSPTITPPPETATGAVATETVRQGLQNLKEQMNGMSETDKKIADFYLSNIDSTNAANLRVLEHQISSDPYMSPQAKNAAIAGLKRDVMAERAGTVGTMAVASAERAQQAALNAITLGQQVRGYEEVTKPAANVALQTAVENLRQSIDTYNNYTTENNRLNLARSTEELNQLIDKYKNYIAPMNQLDLEAARVDIEAKKADLGTSIWNDVQSMVNQGADIKRVNKYLTERGKTALSDSEYSAIIQAGPLGERDWNRSLTSANMLLTTPGASNKEAAAAAYESLFPGVDFDFTELISKENSQRFSDGLSQMASYVSTNAKFEDVLTAMKKDGTLEMMGMTEDQAAQLYNSIRVNTIDAQKNVIEESGFYQSLVNSSDPKDRQAAADWMEFFRQDMLGMLDYDTLHEYNLYDQSGVLQKTIYAKDDSEAAKAAAKNGFRYEDTGKVEFRMASTIDTDAAINTTGITPTPSLEGQGSDKPVGTKYVEDGRVYEVGAGNEIKELKIDPATEQWTKTADDILALGENGNPYYKNIIDARAKSIIDGSHEIGNRIEDDVLYSSISSSVLPWDFGTIVGKEEKGAKSMEFSAKPKVGSIIKYGDKIYKVNTAPSWVSGKAYSKAGSDINQYIVVTDLSDGKQYTIEAERNNGTVMKPKGA